MSPQLRNLGIPAPFLTRLPKHSPHGRGALPGSVGMGDLGHPVLPLPAWPRSVVLRPSWACPSPGSSWPRSCEPRKLTPSGRDTAPLPCLSATSGSEPKGQAAGTMRGPCCACPTPEGTLPHRQVPLTPSRSSPSREAPPWPPRPVAAEIQAPPETLPPTPIGAEHPVLGGGAGGGVASQKCPSPPQGGRAGSCSAQVPTGPHCGDSRARRAGVHGPQPPVCADQSLAGGQEARHPEAQRSEHRTGGCAEGDPGPVHTGQGVT